ncbi:MAG: glutamate racemase [bacterium]
MIGFFDSGFGGLTIARKFSDIAPKYDTIFLGDNARTPYGARSEETIYHYTCEGVQFLFDNGAELVILACNTASAVALRRIQQEWLPKYAPDKRVLGIIIPTAEEVVLHTKGAVGVLATSATVRSRAFTNELKKRNPDISIFEEACPLFVPIIEEGEHEWEGTRMIAKKYISNLFKNGANIDSVILGCTHYALIEKILLEEIGAGVRVISQGTIIVPKIIEYLVAHPDLEKKLAARGNHTFFSTEQSDRINTLASRFYGAAINVELAVL